MTPQAPSLSIIIPALNEAGHLPQLLSDLSRQRDIHFETIVVDGGSDDDTLQNCAPFSRQADLRLSLLSSEPGRGRQMNRGVDQATANDYLFLHADSRIDHPHLLSQAQRHMAQQRRQLGSHRLAGHFPLRFVSESHLGGDYYYYQSKTCLNRPDCINGDQGFWLAKDFFRELDGFDESLPYMEDARLAASIFARGRWITLPGEITTSARRFETEGFIRRQIVNSFLCNFNAMGVQEFFHGAPNAYQRQDKSGRLRMTPFLKLAHRQMNGDGVKIALQRWYQTGAYIACNAWQLAFALDCRRKRKQGLPPGSEQAKWLEWYDTHLADLARWPLVKGVTALLTVLWFYSLFLRYRNQ